MRFLEKLKARVAKITVGDPENPAVGMGPVINAGALKTISEYIEKGKSEGRVLNGGGRAGEKGFFLEPTVYRRRRVRQHDRPGRDLRAGAGGH